jgi:cytochrome P450
MTTTTNPVSEFFSQPVIEDPYPTYEALRSDGPVSYVENLDAYMVTGHAECMEAMRNHDIFRQWDGSELNAINPDVAEELASMFGIDAQAAQEGGLRGIASSSGFGLMVDTLVTANPPEHTRYRHVTNQAWSAKRTAVDAEPRIREVTNFLVDDFASSGRVEFMAEFAAPLPSLVISEILGLPKDDWTKFKEWSDVGLTLLGGNLERDQVRAAVEAMMNLTAYLGAAIEARRSEPTDDALSALLRGRDKDGEGLDQQELLSIALHLLGAGHETTINAMGNTMWLILKDPEVRDALLADRSLIAAAVGESLRLEAPVQFLFRQTNAPTTLGGVDLPSDAKVCLIFAAANRDPAVFPEPERFDLHRTNTRHHISFGFGIHRCIGEPLSIKELEVAVDTLLTRLPNLELAPDQDFSHNPHPFLRRFRELHLSFGADGS